MSTVAGSLGTGHRRRPTASSAVVPRPGAYRLVAAPDRPGQARHAHRPRPTRGPEAWASSAAGPTAAVRRRRVLLGTVVAALLLLLALPWGGAGGRSLATSGAALVGDPIAHHALYVVQPGDSLWSIAARLDPTGDPRPVVAKLASQVGGDTVVPGEHLVLP
ncbi:MAG TPA: LysM domain-containing protein [Acidimicrobiales bacterium]|nr:LysM domain-containing protein [Acidimicrobiales bacterium]